LGWRESPRRVAGSDKVGPDLVGFRDGGHIAEVLACSNIGMFQRRQLEAEPRDTGRSAVTKKC
jgi:hypothetical protein